MPTQLAKKLIDRGDILEIINGRLSITAASGIEVPADWLSENQEKLAIEIIQQLKINPLVYLSYSAGKFNKGRYSGVQLQFEHLVSGKQAYCIFNAETTYSRGKKKGQPLPSKQFRVGKQSSFTKFWKNTCLDSPPRLSSFHDYMGNLKKLLFVARISHGEKLEKETLQPLNISFEQITAAFCQDTPDISHTTAIQHPDKIHTSLPYNETFQSHTTQGLETKSTTGQISYGIWLQGNAVTRDNIIPINNHKKQPQEQSVDEWLADYGD